MSEKNGARKRDREVPGPMCGSSQIKDRKRMIKLVTKSGTASVIQSAAATQRITRVMAAVFGIPQDPVGPEITRRVRTAMARTRSALITKAEVFMERAQGRSQAHFVPTAMSGIP